MSYCRWIDSSWYIFWNTGGGSTKGEQLLSIWYSINALPNFTYDELTELPTFEDRLAVILDRGKITREELTDEDIKDLREALDEWFNDIEEEFKEDNRQT